MIFSSLNDKQYLIKLDNVRGEALTIGLIIGILFGGIAASIWLYAPNQNLQNQVTQLQTQVNSLKIEADKITGLRGQITSLAGEKTALQNQLAILNSQITSLQSTLENKNQEITGLTSSYSELNSEYQNLLTYYHNLLEIYSLPDSYTGNYENLSSYLEIDPDNSITVTDARVSWNNMDRRLSRELWNNYLGGSVDFTHQFRFCISQIEAGDSDPREIVRFWMLSSGNDRLVLYAEQANAIDSEYNLVFHQSIQGSNVFVYYSGSFDAPLELNEVYCVKITRVGNDYTLKVFNMANKLLIDTGKMGGVSANYSKLSLSSIGGYGDDFADWSAGYIEYLQFL